MTQNIKKTHWVLPSWSPAQFRGGLNAIRVTCFLLAKQNGVFDVSKRSQNNRNNLFIIYIIYYNNPPIIAHNTTPPVKDVFKGGKRGKFPG